jgi:hypothetical protein
MYMDASRMQDVLTLIQMEYLEMPDLKLTLRQAKRLFDLPLELCENALSTLVSVGFLVQTRDGSFLRRGGETEACEPFGDTLPGDLAPRPVVSITRPIRS